MIHWFIYVGSHVQLGWYFVVTLNYGYGDWKISLGRKNGSWSYTELAYADVPTTDLPFGEWGTLTIHDDGTGVLSVDLAGTEILSYDEGANYLPAVYAANYASGSVWGAFTHRYFSYADQNIDNLVVTPEPTTLALLAMGGVAMLRRRR